MIEEQEIINEIIKEYEKCLFKINNKLKIYDKWYNVLLTEKYKLSKIINITNLYYCNSGVCNFIGRYYKYNFKINDILDNKIIFRWINSKNCLYINSFWIIPPYECKNRITLINSLEHRINLLKQFPN